MVLRIFGKKSNNFFSEGAIRQVLKCAKEVRIYYYDSNRCTKEAVLLQHRENGAFRKLAVTPEYTLEEELSLDRAASAIQMGLLSENSEVVVDELPVKLPEFCC